MLNTTNPLILQLNEKQEELDLIRDEILKSFHRDSGGITNTELFKNAFKLEEEILLIRKNLGKLEGNNESK